MARIPESEIERLKSHTSVQRLVEAKGVVLVWHGADLHGRCPFHDDRTPSLVVSKRPPITPTRTRPSSPRSRPINRERRTWRCKWNGGDSGWGMWRASMQAV